MPDPKLKKAMEQIKKICLKNDIAAQVILVSPTHSEFLYHLSPSWSVVTLKNNGLRFRSKKEDFPNKKIQDRNTELSARMLLQIRDISGKTFMDMEKIVAILSEHMDIKHEPFKGFKPHQDEDQN